VFLFKFQRSKVKRLQNLITSRFVIIYTCVVGSFRQGFLIICRCSYTNVCTAYAENAGEKSYTVIYFLNIGDL
jgi:hypothetical protein